MIPIAKPYLGQEEIDAVIRVLKSGIIAQGPKVLELEEKFAQFCNSKYAVALNSGTAALHTALHVSGVMQKDEVVTTPFTFISTANSILMQNAIPVFVDIDEDTFNINPEKIDENITKKTKVIISVDLYGQLCDYGKIEKIAEKHNITIIEDAAQAVNAQQNGRKSGNFGDVSTFSFYATKNITCGEGGMLTTDNKEFAQNARLFRQHGRSKLSAYEYVNEGHNYRTTDINAAILLEQLKKVEEITKKRIENAQYLSAALNKIKGLKVPAVKEGNMHVFHQYTIRITEDFKRTRDETVNHLKKKEIGAAIYYPKPLHVLPHYKKFKYKEGDFPIAEKMSRQVVSLPVHPYLTREDLDRIISAVSELE